MATTTSAAPSGMGRVAHELKRPYVQVFAILAIVTVVEVQIPSLSIEKSMQFLLLIASAAVKALLVALYYMHLRYEPRVLRWLPVAPLAFAAALILTVLMD